MILNYSFFFFGGGVSREMNMGGVSLLQLRSPCVQVPSSHILQRPLQRPQSDMPHEVVLRHRPDECFRRCFDADAAGEVLAKWRDQVAPGASTMLSES